MTSHLHKILNQEIPRDYRTEIPNIVFELLHLGEISPQDFSLYCLFRRIAGEKGACWVGQRGLVDRLHCRHEAIVESKRNLSRPFDQLNGKPLIEIHPGDYKKGKADTITIIDIWPENHFYFKEISTCARNGSPLCAKRITPVRETDHKKQPLRNNQQETVLCSSPPVAVSSLIEIEKIDCEGRKFLIRKNDLFTACIQNDKDWTHQEILKAWEIVVNYKQPIREWIPFCDGLIQKIRLKYKINSLKENVCLQKKKSNMTKELKPTSETIKQKVSAKDMMTQPFANCKFLNGLPIR